jgi:hypothetical protein
MHVDQMRVTRLKVKLERTPLTTGQRYLRSFCATQPCLQSTRKDSDGTKRQFVLSDDLLLLTRRYLNLLGAKTRM